MKRLIACVMAMGANVLVYAQPTMDIGALAKFARDTGVPAKAILTGPGADYLQKQLNTSAPVIAEAMVVRTINSKCQRIRVNLSVPDVIVTAKNPVNPDESRTGPFDLSMELNLCN
jgi:hypothetical protein